VKNTVQPNKSFSIIGRSLLLIGLNKISERELTCMSG